jgi:hypothetical protein
MFSPDHTDFSTKNNDDFLLQISKHSSPILEQHTFFPSVFYGEDPDSNYILRALRGSALCVTVGRLRFHGYAYSSYTCQGLCARRYGLQASQGLDFRHELTARTPLELFFSPSYSSWLLDSMFFAMRTPKDTKGPTSHQTCYELRALRVGR